MVDLHEKMSTLSSTHLLLLISSSIPKSGHEPRYDSVIPFLPLFEVEGGLTTIHAKKGRLSRFYPSALGLLMDLVDVVS